MPLSVFLLSLPKATMRKNAKSITTSLTATTNDFYNLSTKSLISRRLNRESLNFLSNLVGNTIEFTKKGSISYGYKLTDTPIIFHVTDIGIGIEPEKVERIFERFTKLNNYAQGTGLGLSICKSIIERPGGKISVSSEFGKGSKFIGKDAWYSNSKKISFNPDSL